MTFDKTKAMRNAEKYLAQGKIRAAIGEYEQVVKFDSRDFGTMNMLGDLYSKNTDVKSAIRCYTAVGDHYGKQGFAQKAISVYNKISRLDPNSIEVWQKLAELYKQKGSLTDARAHYKKVADHFERSGQKLEALEMWKEIALLDPGDTQSYSNLADSYLAEGQVEDALDAYIEVGNRFANKGQHDAATATFEKALSFNAADVRALTGYTRSQTALGRAKECAGRLAESAEEFPHNREIRFLLIDCLIAAGEIGEAEKAVIRLVELEPANYPKFLELANIYIQNDDVVSASRILSMSSEHMLVGGQAEEFSELVSAVLDREPDQLDALRLRARYCSWQRDEKALCTSLDRLATVSRAAGSVEDERNALVQLTMLVPHDVDYATRLRELNEEHGYESGEAEENLFDKRFLKNGNNSGNATVEFVTAEADETGDFEYTADVEISETDTGFAFAGEVTEVSEPETEESFGAAAVQHRLQKEIDGIRFYIENGYLELAEKAAGELSGEFGERREIQVLIDEIASLTASTPGEEQVLDAVPAVADVPKGIDLDDLRNELGLEDVVVGDEADYETHFNTGTAYKEMGLIEQAITEFQQAVSVLQSNDETRRFFACANLLGFCFMEQNMPQLALKWFDRALQTPDLNKDEKQGLWYELAAAYEANGDQENAGKFFEQVYAENAKFRDVSERVRAVTVNH
jgi:tetratricopeptide (TPR) repeat protein